MKERIDGNTIRRVRNWLKEGREEKVFAFFRHKMKCSPDVATILARLCCDKGSLPQGSASSPILSYWAYSEMWDQIFEISKSAGNEFTLYVDDLTVSGESVTKDTVWKIRQQIHKHGLSIKASKTQWVVDKPADITGVIVRPEGLRLPNRQHKKLSQAKSDFSKPGGNRKLKHNVLQGRVAQANQILRFG